MKNNHVILNNVTYFINEGTKDIKILDNISCEFKPSSISVITGPSGSGKTTLLYSIAGIIDNIKGQIIINGTNINSNKSNNQRADFRLNNISIIFQNLNLFSFMNVEENILIPLYVKKHFINEAIKEKVANYLDIMKLGQIQNKSISALSGGEQQRVAIIRALISEPKIILCDEPTASLDQQNIEIFMQTLDTVKNETGIVIIVVTHDDRVKKYANTLFNMLDGRMEQILERKDNV